MIRAVLLLPWLAGCALTPAARVAVGLASIPVVTTVLQVYRPGAGRPVPAPAAPASPLVVIHAERCSITRTEPVPSYVTR